jgi:hypothetical protein
MDNSNAHDMGMQDFPYLMDNSNAHNIRIQDMVLLKDYLFFLLYK